jgi:TolB-like protein
MARPHLSLFGGFEVAGDAAAQAALTRKARAMLAYLALQSGHAQSREKLAALLWGGNGELQARTNLRQALSIIRKAIPSSNGGRFNTDGDSVVLNLDDLEFDVARFETLAAGSAPQHWEEAISLYRGDLLDGFSLREEPFEDWLRMERERLRAVAVAALEKLTAHYAAAEDFARCAQAAARLLALEPLREDIHRALMRAYAAQGRFNLALKQHEACRDALQKELGLQPEPETRRLFDELRARRMTSGEAQAPSREPETSSKTRAAVRRQLALIPPFDSDLPVPAKPSVAILPFDCSGGDADQTYFANGMAENIITGLTRFHDLFVIGHKSSLAMHEASRDVQAIGRRLGVAHVVEGSVRKAGDRVRVTAQLVEAATGRRLWAEQYDRSIDDLFSMQDDIADLIVTTLAGRIERASRERAAEKPAKDMVAYDHLLRAREYSRHRTQDGELAARGHLDRALALDQDLASAYACYAISYVHEYEAAWGQDRERVADRAFQLGRKAVALDETDSYAHHALAYAAHYWGRIEFAQKEIDRAIRLNRYDYHNLCVRAWITMFSGRPGEALTDLNEALRLNPFASENCLITIGIAEFMAALYRESCATFARMSSWDPLRYACLAACQAELGQDEQARAAAEKVRAVAAIEFGGDPVSALERWRAYAEAMFLFQDSADLARFADGLHKAGLPFERCAR